MKTTVSTFPFLLVLLCGLFLFSACKKNNSEPQPDAATGISGQYTITYLGIDGSGVELPQGGVSGAIQLTRKNETTVQASMTLTQDGNSDTYDLGELTTARQGDGTVSLSMQGQQVGTVKDKQLTLVSEDETNSIEIRATRQ